MRVGRGNSSGYGNTSSRGQKGQKSRSGYSNYRSTKNSNLLGINTFIKDIKFLRIKYKYILYIRYLILDLKRNYNYLNIFTNKIFIVIKNIISFNFILCFYKGSYQCLRY